MCLKSDRLSSAPQHAPRNPRPSRRSRITGDAVRSQRMRGLIELSVVTAFGPAGQMLSCRPIGRGTNMRPFRGGSAVAFARQAAMYLGHVGCGLTYTEAGSFFGRDRTTAAHACSVIEDCRDDPIFDRIIELLERCVRMGLCQIEPDLAARLRRL